MNNIIYSANVMQTFLGPTVGVAFFFLLGVSGLLKMRSEKRPRLDLPFAAMVALLLLVGASLCASSIYSFTLGSQTIVRRLTDKAEVVSTTSRGATSQQYRLYFGPFTAFDVPDKSILDKMAPGDCYQVTAYQNLAPLALISQADTGTQVMGLVAEIRLASAQECP